MIICLCGPTAAGKSATALQLARHFKIEIINMDSATIYRGMDIGTAKPSLAEQQICPQHLLDIRDPQDSYSAAEFVHDTHQLIEHIQARGKIPLIVGGTMMYYNALRKGMDQLPSADPVIREALNAQAQQLGWPAMHQRLQAIDPLTAERLAPTDSQRIQRALEVFQITGQPLSTLLGKATPSPYQYTTISFEPPQRQMLHERIAQRFDQMLEQGLVHEVEQLYHNPLLHPDLPSIRCVGYRQIWQYLAGEVSLSEARELGIIATRHLAKRQLTWLRAIPQRIVIDCFAPHATEQAIQVVQDLLHA